jgi:5-formyltetrahydrofolate cyclo-ligase
MQRPDEILQQKKELRALARATRQDLPGKDALSRVICGKLAELPQYAAARTLMIYVDFGSEVRTRPFFPIAWGDGKRLVVPYCVEDRLELFELKNLAELLPGTLGILEPAAVWRERADRRVEVAELDLVAVPGLAFDRRGGRLGQGKGYYDRFLPRVRPDALRVALAFECQVLPEVPMLPQDVRVDKIITEKAVYSSR